MTGVELDPTTAAIAAALYPSADIVTPRGSRHPAGNAGTFTAVVGNVPFGEFKVYDPEFNPAGHTIHNHFLVKSLRPDRARRRRRRRHLRLHPGRRLARRPAGPARPGRPARRGPAAVRGVPGRRRHRRRHRPADPAPPHPTATPRSRCRVGTGRRHRHRRRHHRGEPVLRRPPRTHPRHPAVWAEAPHHRAELIIRPLPGQDLGDRLADRLTAIVVRARTAGLTLIPPHRAVAAGPGLGRRAPGGRPMPVPAPSAPPRAGPGSNASTPGPVPGRPTRSAPGRPSTAAQTGREMRARCSSCGTPPNTSSPSRPPAPAPTTGHAARAAATGSTTRTSTEFGPINRFTEQRRAPAGSWRRNLDPDEIDPDWPTRQRIGQRRRGRSTTDGDPVLQVHRVRHRPGPPTRRWTPCGWTPGSPR